MSSLFHNLPVYSSAESLKTGYAHLLEALLTAPSVGSVTDVFSVGSGWGEKPRDFREMLGLSFVVDTDDVMLDSTVRPLNQEYALGSSAWILEGRNDLDAMVKLNPRGEMFSMDSFTLSGAFGYRLRSKYGDQLNECVELLRKDPTSRRGIAFIGDAGDVVSLSKDFPCAASVQFFVREGKLISLVTMRSQSMFGVFPYDVVNFRFVHQFMAEQVNVPAGGLIFSCNSAHVYEEEVSKIEGFLKSDFRFVNPGFLDLTKFEQVYE